MGRITGDQLQDLTLANLQIATDAAIAYSKLAALTSANILVGNASNVASVVPVAGDISIDNAGTVAISSNVIVNADVNTSAAIVESKLLFSTGTGHNHDGTNSKLISQGVDIWRETPTGTINGTNTLFTIATAPNVQDMMIFLNGVSLDLVATATKRNEYEHVSGATVFTLGDPPRATGDADTVIAHYQVV